MRQILFLDIDGVLNAHDPLPGSRYCGIHLEKMALLNRVIEATGCKLVISSAWRYLMLNGSMNKAGFENMLLVCGLVAEHGVVEGFTVADEVIEPRELQIRAWLEQRDVNSWAVVDDDPMQMQFGADEWRVVRPNGDVGLTAAEAERLIEILTE